MTDTRLVEDHCNNLESVLLAEGRVPSISGSTVNRGTAREVFVRRFLEDHLGGHLSIGSGEIIGSDSKVGERRPQLDVVVHHRNFPKLALGGGLSAYFAESILAEIEVKSVLTEEDVRTATKAAHAVKSVARNVDVGLSVGFQPPAILAYVVAYDGPVNIETVHGWVQRAQKDIGIVEPTLGPSLEERVRMPSPALDAVYVLGRGTLQFDNSPITWVPDADRAKRPMNLWHGMQQERGNLFHLFLNLLIAGSGFSTRMLKLDSYASGISRAVTIFAPR